MKTDKFLCWREDILSLISLWSLLEMFQPLTSTIFKSWQQSKSFNRDIFVRATWRFHFKIFNGRFDVLPEASIEYVRDTWVCLMIAECWQSCHSNVEILQQGRDISDWDMNAAVLMWDTHEHYLHHSSYQHQDINLHINNYHWIWLLIVH